MTGKRGRPLKFGRPTQLLTVSLPADVVDWLKAIDPDPGWAIVSLFEKSQRRSAGRGTPRAAELVQLPGKRALILVRPDAFRALNGVSVIPLSDGRGFLALTEGRGIADLEVSVVDKLDSPDLTEDQRRALAEVRQQLREWRHQGLHFESRSILVVEQQAVGQPARSLSSLTEAR